MLNKNKKVLVVEYIIIFVVNMIFISLFSLFFINKHIEIYLLVVFLFLTIMMGLVSTHIIMSLFKNVDIIGRSELFDKITKILPGGFIVCNYNKELSIKKLDKGFLNFVGYNRNEIENIFEDKFVNMLSKQDASKLYGIYKNKLTGNLCQINYNLKCKDQHCISVISICRFNKQNNTIESFIVDPTTFLEIQEQKNIDAERYRIVAEQSESIIFDYDLRNESIVLNSNFKNKFGYEINSHTILCPLIKKEKLVYEEDYYKFAKEKLLCNDYNEFEARLKKIDGEYIWCKIRMSSIYDKDNNAIRMIGKIIDVDKSRKEKQLLIEKTRRDVMTGLYNKIATETLINDIILEKENDSLCAFMLFDIDNFKSINDNFGHIQGDYVLSKLSDGIKMTFRSSDIIGRIGGDEFVIFIKDLPSEYHAYQKAMDILEIIENSFDIKNDKFNITTSIGIAFFNKDGKTYKELLAKADKALYAAKNCGKNTFKVYDKTIESK